MRIFKRPNRIIDRQQEENEREQVEVQAQYIADLEAAVIELAEIVGGGEDG